MSPIWAHGDKLITLTPETSTVESCSCAHNQASPIDVAYPRVASDMTTDHKRKTKRESKNPKPKRSPSAPNWPALFGPPHFPSGWTRPCTFWTLSSAKSLSPARCATIWGVRSLHIAPFCFFRFPGLGSCARDSPTTCLVNPHLQVSRG